MYSVGVAAFITVALGLSSNTLINKIFDASAVAPIVALVLSGTVTVITSWQAFAGYEWKWIRYTGTLGELYRLRDDLLMKRAAKKGATDDDVQRIYDRLSKVLQETNAEWTRRRSQAERDGAAGAQTRNPSRKKEALPKGQLPPTSGGATIAAVVRSGPASL
jgi:hypothetical protein